MTDCLVAILTFTNDLREDGSGCRLPARYDQWPTDSQQPLAPLAPRWILGGGLPPRAQTHRAFDHLDPNANDPDRVV
jgi:hypothetical protein